MTDTNKITYDAAIAARQAFAGRRKSLLDNWYGAANAASRTFWAERLTVLNDAEIAVFRALEAR